MADPAVLPCPFCGRRNWKCNQEPGASAWLECVSCGATGPAVVVVGGTQADTREAAMGAWNRRQPKGTQTPAALAISDRDRSDLNAAADFLHVDGSLDDDVAQRCAVLLRRIAGGVTATPTGEHLRALAMQWQDRAGRLEAKSDEPMQAFASQLQECSEDLLEALRAPGGPGTFNDQQEPRNG